MYLFKRTSKLTYYNIILKPSQNIIIIIIILYVFTWNILISIYLLFQKTIIVIGNIILIKGNN